MPDRPQHTGPSHGPGDGLDRRTFLAATAAGALALGAPGVTSRAAAPVAPGHPARPAQPALKGAALGEGWSVQAVPPPEAGGVRVSLRQEGSGRTCHVLLCRAAPGSGAMASAAGLDLFLLNAGGDGARRTPDDEVALVRRLAMVAAERGGGLPAAHELLTRAQRQRRYDPIDHADPLAPVSGA